MHPSEDEFRLTGDVPESANPPLPNAKNGTAKACMPGKSCSLSAAAALSEAVARLGLLRGGYWDRIGLIWVAKSFY